MESRTNLNCKMKERIIKLNSEERGLETRVLPI